MSTESSTLFPENRDNKSRSENYPVCNTDQNERTTSDEESDNRVLHKRLKNQNIQNLKNNLPQAKTGRCSSPKHLRKRNHKNVKRCLFGKDNDNEHLEVNVRNKDNEQITSYEEEIGN